VVLEQNHRLSEDPGDHGALGDSRPTVSWSPMPLPQAKANSDTHMIGESK